MLHFEEADRIKETLGTFDHGAFAPDRCGSGLTERL
jgi:hypothetical protein